MNNLTKIKGVSAKEYYGHANELLENSQFHYLINTSDEIWINCCVSIMRSYHQKYAYGKPVLFKNGWYNNPGGGSDDLLWATFAGMGYKELSICNDNGMDRDLYYESDQNIGDSNWGIDCIREKGHWTPARIKGVLKYLYPSCYIYEGHEQSSFIGIPWKDHEVKIMGDTSYYTEKKPIPFQESRDSCSNAPFWLFAARLLKNKELFQLSDEDIVKCKGIIDGEYFLFFGTEYNFTAACLACPLYRRSGETEKELNVNIPVAPFIKEYNIQKYLDNCKNNSHAAEAGLSKVEYSYKRHLYVSDGSPPEKTNSKEPHINRTGLITNDAKLVFFEGTLGVVHFNDKRKGISNRAFSYNTSAVLAALAESYLSVAQNDPCKKIYLKRIIKDGIPLANASLGANYKNGQGSTGFTWQEQPKIAPNGIISEIEFEQAGWDNGGDQRKNLRFFKGLFVLFLGDFAEALHYALIKDSLSKEDQATVLDCFLRISDAIRLNADFMFKHYHENPEKIMQAWVYPDCDFYKKQAIVTPTEASKACVAALYLTAGRITDMNNDQNFIKMR